MECDWSCCNLLLDNLILKPVKKNIDKIDGYIIMLFILFTMNIYCLISQKKLTNIINPKKKVFKKPVEREYKDTQIQTEEYEEPNSARSTEIRQKQATLLYPVTFKKMNAEKDEREASWAPVKMLELQRVKEAIVSYGMHSPFVKQMLNSWSCCNRVTPKDWLDMVTAVLEAGTLMQFKSWWREEAKTIEQRNRARGIEVSQDQLLGEGDYADIERQSLYSDHLLDLCRMAALNAWDRIEEIGKKSETFTKIIQSPKETFTDFLHRLTTAVNRMVPDSEARRIIIESLAFENANAQCRKILRPLKARSAPLEDWIRETINMESFDSDDNWVGELISRGMRKNKNVKCYNCGREGHIKRDCKQGVPRNNAFGRNNPKRTPLPSGICRRCGKGRHWTNECRSTRDRQGNFLPLRNAPRGLSKTPRSDNFLPSGNAPRGLSEAPISSPIQSYPAIVEEIPSQDN